MINSTKDYYDEKLYEAIKRRIPEGKYGEFTEMVIDVCMRRSYTFGLTQDEILKDVDALLENCEEIKFADKKIFGSEFVLGHINLQKKILRINKDYFENNPDYEKMYETFTHEIYHGMSARQSDSKVFTGLQFFDEKGNKKGTALNEVFNEVAADMASYNKNEKDEQQFKRNTIGYGNLTFIVPMLASSLGVSVKELTKAGIHSRDELMDFMLSKMPENGKEGFIDSFARLEYNLEQLKTLGDKKTEELTEDDKINIEDACTGIANFGMNLMYGSIINDTRPISKELQLEYEYRRKAASSIVEDFQKKFKNKMPEGALDRIKENINTASRNRLNSLVMGYNHLSRIQGQISKSELDALRQKMNETYPKKKYRSFQQFEKEVIGDKVVELIDFDKKYSEVAYDADGQDNTYRQHIIAEDFDDFKQWDNSSEMEYMKKIFEKEISKNQQVTLLDMAQCDQEGKVTTEEIKSVEEAFSRMMSLDKNREGENARD